jgi:ParB family chromosome partitioning protein
MTTNKKALSYKTGTVFLVPPEELTVVGLDTKDTKETHALFDERIKLPLDEALVRNIMAKGVIENIIVTKNGETDKGMPIVEVVAGRRRTLHAREANKRLTKEGKEPLLVPCTIRRGDSNDLFGVMISENVHRRNDDVLVQAENAIRMLNMGSDKEAISIAFGITTRTLDNWLKIAELHPEVKKAIKAERISPNAAMQLASAKREEQPALMEKALTVEKVSAKEVERVVAEKRTGDKKERTDDAPSMGELRRIYKKLLESKTSHAEESISLLGIMVGEVKPKTVGWFNTALRSVRKK